MGVSINDVVERVDVTRAVEFRSRVGRHCAQFELARKCGIARICRAFLPTHVSRMIQAISSDLERLVQLAQALADAARQETLPLFRMQLEVVQPKNLFCPLGHTPLAQEAGTKYGELITRASQRRSRNQALYRDSPLARCNSDPEYRHSPISVRKAPRIDAYWPQPPEDRSAQRPREAKRTLNLAARARRRVPIRRFLAGRRRTNFHFAFPRV